MTPILYTPRLVLQPYVPADEARFVALFGDPRVSVWMGNGPSTAEEYSALFKRIFSKVYAENLFDVWAVREQGRYVGHAEIKWTDAASGHEIIYALSHDVWGRGLGTEVAEALIRYGFDVLGLSEVHATVAAENTASMALLIRIGFVHARDIQQQAGVVTCVLTRRREVRD
jgi:RimJ/RimL family protein N-acetyltransferase